MTGMGYNADAVLDGTFVVPPGTDPYAVKLLYQLKREPVVDQAPPMSLDLPLDRARERSSSGPSSLHFGHYISGTMDMELAGFHRTIVHIPHILGYSPARLVTRD
jgi:hypothetical protein